MGSLNSIRMKAALSLLILALASIDHGETKNIILDLEKTAGQHGLTSVRDVQELNRNRNSIDRKGEQRVGNGKRANVKINKKNHDNWKIRNFEKEKYKKNESLTKKKKNRKQRKNYKNTNNDEIEKRKNNKFHNSKKTQKVMKSKNTVHEGI